jgi:hypothetical protein
VCGEEQSEIDDVTRKGPNFDAQGDAADSDVPGDEFPPILQQARRDCVVRFANWDSLGAAFVTIVFISVVFIFTSIVVSSGTVSRPTQATP